MILSATTDTAVETGDPLLNDLVATSGMSGMLDTVWLIICAMCFGGVMYGSEACSWPSRVCSCAWPTVRSASWAPRSRREYFFNLVTGDQYISIILTGNLFRNLYDKRGPRTAPAEPQHGGLGHRNLGAHYRGTRAA